MLVVADGLIAGAPDSRLFGFRLQEGFADAVGESCKSAILAFASPREGIGVDMHQRLTDRILGMHLGMRHTE